MSRTRNQRRRDRMLEKISRWGMVAVLAILLCMVARQCADIERMQQEINSRQQVTVVRAEDYLPAGFDPSSPGYQAALQRYDIENGLIIPEQKEAAPELAGSEAGDADNSAS